MSSGFVKDPAILAGREDLSMLGAALKKQTPRGKPGRGFGNMRYSRI